MVELWQVATSQKTALPLTTIDSAKPEAKDLLKAAQKKMSFVPNMYNAMAHSPDLLKTYLDGYAVFRAESGFSPAEQEVVFLSISHTNHIFHTEVDDAFSKHLWSDS